MPDTLRLLMVEDSEADAELLARELKRASLERRERALQQGLQTRWHRLGPDAPATKSGARS